MAGILVLLFIVVPIVEIYVIVQVGQLIGVIPTVLLLLVESLIGAWLVRREGRRAWRALRASLTAGAMPSRALADAGLILVGGTLLLTPGFVTDVVGFFFVLPFTRPLARRLLTLLVTRRAGAVILRRAGGNRGRTQPGRVVQGRVVRDDDPPDSESPGRAAGG